MKCASFFVTIIAICLVLTVWVIHIEVSTIWTMHKTAVTNTHRHSNDRGRGSGGGGYGGEVMFLSLQVNDSNNSQTVLASNDANRNMTTMSTSPTTPTLTVSMTTAEKSKLVETLNGSRTYVEWGTGGSTLLAARMVQSLVVSIEHYVRWCDLVQQHLHLHNAQNVRFICVNHSFPMMQWGKLPSLPKYAIMHSRGNIEPKNKTTTQMQTELDNMTRNLSQKYVVDALQGHVSDSNTVGQVFDVALVDGRFRMACALELIRSAYVDCEHSKVLIHDFWNRPYYHAIVMKWYTAIDRVDTLAVFTCKHSFQHMNDTLRTDFMRDYEVALRDQQR